jgi:hypothetical protein
MHQIGDRSKKLLPADFLCPQRSQMAGRLLAVYHGEIEPLQQARQREKREL